MKRGKRVFSMVIALVMVLGMLPETSLFASSIDDYKNVTVLAGNITAIDEAKTVGVSLGGGTDYCTVYTQTGGDPYFTVDLANVSLSGKVLGIKYKGTANRKIANDWMYLESAEGGWGPSGGGMLTTSKLVCDEGWQFTTYNIATELTGDGTNEHEIRNTQVDTIRIGAISTTGGVLNVAYVGLFDSEADAQKYDELFCKVYNKVDPVKKESFPPALPDINPENYNFNYPVLGNGASLTGVPYADAGGNIINHFRRTWVPRRGTGASAFIKTANYQYYLQLKYDSVVHNNVYNKDTAFEFSADVRPEDFANHFAGFMFNFDYENSWNNNLFYETNNVNGQASVGQSGIGVSIYPSYIEIYVLRYDAEGSSLKQISYKYELSESIGNAFHKIKVIDGANGRISFYLDNVLFAYVEYGDLGLLPTTAKNYNESFYRTAEIYDANGNLKAKANDALIAKIKSVGMGSRARGIDIDNIVFKQAEKGIKINGVNLEISSDISVNFLVNKADFDSIGYTNPLLNVEFNSEIHPLSANIENRGDIQYYAFKFENLSPKNMNDIITATLVGEKDGKTETSRRIEYSIKQYIQSMLSSYTDSIPRKMFVDMMNYGAATQVFTSYKTSELVNSSLSDMQSFWGTQTSRDYVSVTETSNVQDTDLAKWKNVSLALTSKIEMRIGFIADSKKGLYVKVTDEYGNLLTTIYEGSFFETQASDGSKVYSFSFDDLNPAQMDKIVKFVVCDSTGKAVSGTLTHSIESYAKSVADSSYTELVNLIKAMIKFGDSTKEFVDYIQNPRYTVKFVDHDGTLLKTQKVVSGLPATPPSPPARKDYVFNGWDGNYSQVTGDMTLTAQYGFTLTEAGLQQRFIDAGEKITAFARDMGFTYGNASINPGVNWRLFSTEGAINPNERLVACDRLMAWMLYEVGYTNQPAYYGCDVAGMGFTRLDASYKSSLRPGDIVFISTDESGTGTGHVFVIGSTNLGGNVYLRYDHGSNERIKCVKGTEVTPGKQPFREGIGGYVYALRPLVSKLPPESVGAMQKNPTPVNVAYPNSKGTVLATAKDWCASTSGGGQQVMNYRYTIGSGYDQYQFETMLNVPGAVDDCVWNSCLVGARLPSTNQTPATPGGVWVGFKTYSDGRAFAYVYAGYHPQHTDTWTTPLASIPLPEDVANGLRIDIKTKAKKLIVVDAGESIKYYLESNGVRYLICTINIHIGTQRIAIFDNFNRLKYLTDIPKVNGQNAIGNSGYFMIFAHGNYCNAVGSKLKGCASVRYAN